MTKAEFVKGLKDLRDDIENGNSFNATHALRLIDFYLIGAGVAEPDDVSDAPEPIVAKVEPVGVAAPKPQGGGIPQA